MYLVKLVKTRSNLYVSTHYEERIKSRTKLYRENVNDMFNSETRRDDRDHFSYCRQYQERINLVNVYGPALFFRYCLVFLVRLSHALAGKSQKLHCGHPSSSHDKRADVMHTRAVAKSTNQGGSNLSAYVFRPFPV